MKKIIIFIIAAMLFMYCSIVYAKWTPTMEDDFIPVGLKSLTSDMTEADVIKAGGQPAYIKKNTADNTEILLYVTSYDENYIWVVEVMIKDGKYFNKKVAHYRRENTRKFLNPPIPDNIPST